MARTTSTPEQQSVRVLKVGERVRHILSELLARGEAHDDTLTAHAVSVTEVRMTPDLRNAKAYVKPLLGEDEAGIPVLCYGLRTDFRGDLFPGSAVLLGIADALIELKAVCHCGRKATMNLRIDESGEAETSGAQTEIGGNDRYVALCRKHFREALAG